MGLLSRAEMEPPKLLAQRVDDTAAACPDRLWAEILLSTSPASTFSVDYSLLSSTLARVSALIESDVGPRAPSTDQLTLWYSGPSDIRYAIFLLACSKLGHKALFISPRNSSAAHCRLLETTSCKHVFTSQPDFVKRMAGDQNLQLHPFPEVIELFEKSKGVPPAPNRDYETVADDVFVILHTSGSTNHPKPISITNRGVAIYENWPHLPSHNGESLQDLQLRPGQKMYMSFPMFHKAGCDVVHQSFVFGFSLVFGPLDSPVSATSLASVLKLNVADCGCVPTSVLEDFAARNEDLPLLANWKHVGTGGAPLSHVTGDAISKHTTLRNILGSTETSLLGNKAAEDWSYHFYHPSLGVHFEHHSEDLYEAVIKKTPEHAPFQMVFAVYPDIEEYRTCDLYRKHPSKEGLFEFHGRTDNIIVLSNGEKISPDEVEGVISERNDVDWALIVGSGHFELAMLIAPAEPYDIEHFDRSVHEDISRAASQLLPDHAQISPEFTWVLDLSEHTEVPKSAKGKPQRKAAMEILGSLIDKLYDESSRVEVYSGIQLNPSTPAAIAQSLEKCLKLACPKVAIHSPDDDFFTHGMDSLQALRLYRNIRGGLDHRKVAGWPDMSVQFVYAHPSIRKLVHALTLTEEDEPGMTASELDLVDLEETTSEIQRRLTKQVQVGNRLKFGVALTGSTGSLGSYILDALMRNPAVGTIYCLNRQPTQESTLRQRDMHASNGLRCDFAENNVVFLQSELSDGFLGLGLETYLTLLRNVHFIIHNAWLVNWSAPISAFKPLLEGCANLVSFAQRSQQLPHIIFASSVGAVGSWQEVAQQPGEAVPEEKFEDLKMAEPTPYSRSKLAAEHIFDHARENLGLQVTICRIGQIAGPVLRKRGGWKNQSEWFPSLMLASNSIGLIPEDLGFLDTMDWVPVDVVAEVIAGIVDSNSPAAPRRQSFFARLANPSFARQPDRKSSLPGKSSTTRILHLVHPNPITWSGEGVGAASKALTARSPRVVPLTTWISEFEWAMKHDEDLGESAAARLLDFYRTLADPGKPRRRYATTMSCHECPRLGSAAQIQPAQLEGWIKQWVRPDDIDEVFEQSVRKAPLPFGARSSCLRGARRAVALLHSKIASRVKVSHSYR